LYLFYFVALYFTVTVYGKIKMNIIIQ